MGRSSSLGPIPSDSLGVTPPPERRSRSGLGLRDRFSRLFNRGESSETGAAIVKATEVGTKVGSEAAASRLSVNTHSRAISTASLPRISAVGIPGPIQADNTLRHGVSPGASRIETTPGATLSSGNVDNTQIHANAAVPNRPLLAISALDNPGPIEAGDSAAFEVTILNVGSAPTNTSATGIQSNHHNLPLEQTQRQTSVEPDASGAAGVSKSTWVTDKLVSPSY